MEEDIDNDLPWCGVSDEDRAGTVPDALDWVVESQSMMTIHAAERYRRVDLMRRDHLRDAERRGLELTDVIMYGVRLELAMALSITEAAAAMLMGHAEALVHRYPSVLESMGAARITPRHATDLADAIDGVEPEFRDQLVAPALELAESLPLGSFRRHLRKLIESVRAITLTERYEKALESRRVCVLPAEDGMAWLYALLPAVEAHAIQGRLTAAAKPLCKEVGETRTLDQVRADVLGDLLIDGDTSGLALNARGIRPTAVVTVPALALLGAEGSGDLAASVEGVGPISIERARELCGGAKQWTRVLTHPETGMVVSVGRDRYRPPAPLRRLVRWRADRCMAPGCGVPASRCEIDHNIPWIAGGETRLENLTPFCKGHHDVKHHGRWCVEQIDGSGGAVLWTSPAGRRYRVNPERTVPVFRPVAEAVASADAHGSPPF